MENSIVESLNEKTGELMTVEPVVQSLVFGTQEPSGIIAKATDVANQLAHIVEKAKLYVMIKDKKYVKAEGWTTMAAMLAVFPALDYCRKLEREGELAYEARIILTHISGRTVGAGEAMCSSNERTWSGRDEYAIKSMAQTRALGKACRISFSWIMALAGYEACPAEEMVTETRAVSMPKPKTTVKPTEAEMAIEVQRPPEDDFGPLPPEETKEGPVAAPKKEPASKFYTQLHKISREHKVSPETMKRLIKTMYFKDSSKDLTDTECASLIKLVQQGGIK